MEGWWVSVSTWAAGHRRRHRIGLGGLITATNYHTALDEVITRLIWIVSPSPEQPPPLRRVNADPAMPGGRGSWAGAVRWPSRLAVTYSRPRLWLLLLRRHAPYRYTAAELTNTPVQDHAEYSRYLATCRRYHVLGADMYAVELAGWTFQGRGFWQEIPTMALVNLFFCLKKKIVSILLWTLENWSAGGAVAFYGLLLFMRSSDSVWILV